VPKITLKVPKTAVSAQEGTLVEWFVEDGQRAAIGQPLYSIEMEKSIVEIECPFEGTVNRIGVAGETYKVGTPIAEIVP
jgi:pyruvate/2-oxoglutarate dehydrogenase complex dihydrolipoamide acyltransferase (E2) component